MLFLQHFSEEIAAITHFTVLQETPQWSRKRIWQKAFLPAPEAVVSIGAGTKSVRERARNPSENRHFETKLTRVLNVLMLLHH
jgi:hypothetical protein